MTRAGPPEVSIIIPCLGQAAELHTCLQALDQQQVDIQFEITVVDSASDPLVRAAAAAYPKVRLLRSSRGLTPGAARNLGARAAKGAILGFLDADCTPEPGWIAAGVKCLGQGAVIVSGPILDAMPWHMIASTDNRLQFSDFPPGRPAGLGNHFPSTHLMLSKATFRVLGGFDEVELVGQDVLFSTAALRHWPQGLRFCPDMRARHHGREHWSDFLAHAHSFGFSRANAGLHMNRSLEWLGRHRGLAPIVVLRRLLYISGRVLQWNLPDLPRFVAQLPLVLIGLGAWTQGFYEGMRARASNSHARTTRS